MWFHLVVPRIVSPKRWLYNLAVNPHIPPRPQPPIQSGAESSEHHPTAPHCARTKTEHHRIAGKKQHPSFLQGCSSAVPPFCPPSNQFVHPHLPPALPPALAPRHQHSSVKSDSPSPWPSNAAHKRSLFTVAVTRSERALG